MKRKALITATAVLLVAVMCLATASYAWFTSGSTNTVTTLDLSVAASDGGLELAPANVKEGDYEAGAFTTSALDITTFVNGYGVVPNQADPKLDDLSINGVAETDGTYDFWNATYANGEWTIDDTPATEGYLLLSFYAKSSAAGTYTLSLDSTLMNDDQFKSAVKIGYAKQDNVTIDSATKLPDKVTNTLGIYPIASTDKYAPVIDETAVAEKVGNNFVAKSATGFGTEIDESKSTAWGSQTLTFTEGETKLITVALWLEGMDKDCTGTWDLPKTSFAIGLVKTNAGA